MRRNFFIVISLTIGLILGTSVSWADINNGLVAYWPFNDNLYDVTGSGYDGEMINGTVSYIQGVKGKGIKLPGTTDSRISLTPWVPGNSSITISGWVKMLNQDEFWFDYQGPIYTSHHGNFSHGFYLRPIMRQGELRIEFGIGANYGTGNMVYYTLDPIEFYGKWHHMAGVVDRENHEIRLYYDGELVAASFLTVGAIYPTKGFIASYDYVWPRDGHPRFVSPSHRLDEIRLYNRALTYEEIQELFFDTNAAPTANAGENIFTTSEDIGNTIVQGTAADEDPDDILQYRWKDNDNILLDWTLVGENGECILYLYGLPIELGTHTLTLEVTDGQELVSDDMILTIENSAPHLAPTGSGVYEINTDVIIGGEVSDFDGDLLSYSLSEGTNIFHSGTIQSIAGGTPIELPNFVISNLCLGVHIIILQVDDGINQTQSKEVTVDIIDTTAPTIAPTSNKTILWPPNHKMVSIVIEANASDNSGGPVKLSAVVSSNEPITGACDEDLSPDWTPPVIDQDSGVIYFQLRAERSDSGDKRIYTTAITATDEANNSTTVNVEIIVPHDRRRK
jgi:hypothetical protein